MASRILILLLFISPSVWAQHPLLHWGNIMLNDTLAQNRLEAGEQFEKALDSILNRPDAWLQRLDTLRTFSSLTSPDERFKLMTWNIPLPDGQFQFHGRILCSSKWKEAPAMVTKLTDASPNLQKAGTKVLSTKEWYGALYYSMCLHQYKKQRYYTVLGWDGNSPFSNKKIIDVLIVGADGQFHFGAPIFDDGKRLRHRIFFEYAEQATMSLRYQPKSERIIFDHLAPSQPSYEGMYEFYSPDFTTDAYHFEKGKWKLEINYEARNEQDFENRSKKPEKGLRPPEK